ncbi:MAG TPA: heme o synthase [Pirellulales bacterium]|nr:heme o synthase [Pirellulales bacterium]
MSMPAVSYADSRLLSWQRVCDYVELTKPKIAALELVTVAVAAVVASSGTLDPWRLFHALLGTALVAAGASAWNQLLERETDALMERTADRPLPAGRLSVREVLGFGSAASLAGVLYLALLVNPLTSALGAATWVLYVCIYTPLKSRSHANTMVGAVAGAMPILMGWAAVGRSLDLGAATLFLIVFLWQFPHFMAIAWIYRRQYAEAGLQMLPVVDPSGLRAGGQAVLAALALLPVSLLPSMVSFAGSVYFAWALLLGAAQLACAAMFLFRLSDGSARMLLRASLVYLPSLLTWLMLGPLSSLG